MGRFKTLMRYGVVGILTFAVYAAVGWLGRAAGLRLFLEASLAFAVAVTVNYMLQRAWVFRDRRRCRDTAPRYAVMVAFGYVVNLAVLSALSHAPQLLAQMCAVGLVIASNACLSFLWVFLTPAASA